MHRILAFLGLTSPLSGLENILEQVANGELAQDDAARQIRELASKPHLPPWFLRLFRIMFAIFAVIGLGFAAYSIAFSIGAKEVPGTVIQMVGGNQKSPIVEYNVGGKRFTHRSSLSSSPPRYFVGEKVSVLYRPDNPKRAQINSFTDRWLFSVMFTCGGLMGVVMSFFIPKLFSAITGDA